MSRFECPSFSLDLPPEARDVSTYCFVLPVGRFHPSVTVKPDALRDDEPFDVYVRAQCEAMPRALAAFELREGPAPVDEHTWRMVCEWGDDERRFRQVHRFVLRARRVFLLAGTVMADSPPELLAAVERALETFSPR